MAALIRLALDPSWTPPSAAARLRALAVDDAVLRRVRTRLVWRLAQRSSSFGERALAIVDAALGEDSMWDRSGAIDAPSGIGFVGEGGPAA